MVGQGLEMIQKMTEDSMLLLILKRIGTSVSVVCLFKKYTINLAPKLGIQFYHSFGEWDMPPRQLSNAEIIYLNMICACTWCRISKKKM